MTCFYLRCSCLNEDRASPTRSSTHKITPQGLINIALRFRALTRTREEWHTATTCLTLMILFIKIDVNAVTDMVAVVQRDFKFCESVTEFFLDSSRPPQQLTLGCLYSSWCWYESLPSLPEDTVTRVTFKHACAKGWAPTERQFRYFCVRKSVGIEEIYLTNESWKLKLLLLLLLLHPSGNSTHDKTV